MSMNLVFRTVAGGHRVPFPFQTPTNLSYSVMEGDSIECRLARIENELMSWTWSEEMIDDMMKECERLMRDPSLELEIE